MFLKERKEWDAVNYVLKALEMDSDYASAFYLKGVGYRNLGNLEEADKAFATYKRLNSSPQNNIKYN